MLADSGDTQQQQPTRLFELMSVSDKAPGPAQPTEQEEAKPAVPLKDALYSKIVNSGRMKLVEEAQSGYLVEENSLKVRPGSGVPVVIRNKELPPQPGQETPITAQLAAAHEPPAETPVLPAEIQSGQVEQGESGSDIRSEISSFSGFMDKSLQSISSEIKPHLKSDLPAVPPPTQTDAVPPATQPVSSSPPLENIQHESAELSKPEENFTNNPVYLPMQSPADLVRSVGPQGGETAVPQNTQPRPGMAAPMRPQQRPVYSMQQQMPPFHPNQRPMHPIQHQMPIFNPNQRPIHSMQQQRPPLNPHQRPMNTMQQQMPHFHPNQRPVHPIQQQRPMQYSPARPIPRPMMTKEQYLQQQQPQAPHMKKPRPQSQLPHRPAQVVNYGMESRSVSATITPLDVSVEANENKESIQNPSPRSPCDSLQESPTTRARELKIILNSGSASSPANRFTPPMEGHQNNSVARPMTHQQPGIVLPVRPQPGSVIYHPAHPVPVQPLHQAVRGLLPGSTGQAMMNTPPSSIHALVRPQIPLNNADVRMQQQRRGSGDSLGSFSSDSSGSELSLTAIPAPSFGNLKRKVTAKRSKLALNPGTRNGNIMVEVDQYREAAKASNDPETQMEFAKFCIEAQIENAEDKQNVLLEGFSWLKRLSNSGFTEAQFYLGNAFRDDEQYERAYGQYSLAAKKLHPGACYYAAIARENGIGTKKDLRGALNWYRKSATNGYKPAMYKLGMSFLNGECLCKPKIGEAIKWFKRAAAVADLENPEPLYQLHLIYENGRREEKILPDEGYSRSVLMEAANLKYPPALFKVGQCLLRGSTGFTKDTQQAFNFFSEAATRGSAEAMFEISGFYLTGNTEIGVPQDSGEAYRRAKAAAGLGYSKAQYGLGLYCEQGIGLNKPDQKAAREWFIQAARQGDRKALAKLGKNVPKDVMKANKSSGECKMM